MKGFYSIALFPLAASFALADTRTLRQSPEAKHEPEDEREHEKEHVHAKPTDKPTDKPTSKPTPKPTPKPTDKPTSKPTDKPTTAKPTEKPTPKPTDKPTAKPTEKPTPAPTVLCRDFTFHVHELWTGMAVEADGTKVKIADASEHIGLKWPFVGPVLDDNTKHEIGMAITHNERVDMGKTWHGEGTYIDLYGCEGKLAFSGFYQDMTKSGYYVITGGTGVFLGADGYIYEEYDDDTGIHYREISIN